MRLGLDDPPRGLAIVGPIASASCAGLRVRLDPLLELRPAREPVLARDHELGVAQAKRRSRDRRVVSLAKSRMPVTDALQRIGVPSPPRVEELARLALRNIEMRPLGQSA
jgi:hypothetical protein